MHRAGGSATGLGRLVLGEQLILAVGVDTEEQSWALWAPSHWEGSSLALVSSVSMVAMHSGCELHVRQETRRAILGQSCEQVTILPARSLSPGCYLCARCYDGHR